MPGPAACNASITLDKTTNEMATNKKVYSFGS